MKTGIIIPCHNDKKKLDVTAYLSFIEKGDDYHLCFVNDGRKNNTITLLKNIESTNPKLSVIDIKKNAGKAAAVRTGAKYLTARADINFVQLML